MKIYKAVNLVLTHGKVTTVSLRLLPKLKKKIDKEITLIVKDKKINALHPNHIKKILLYLQPMIGFNIVISINLIDFDAGCESSFVGGENSIQWHLCMAFR